jgi:nitrite reductase/ring-hydroxylating ferredoxin subunit
MAARERLICSADALMDGGDGVRFEIVQQGSEMPAFAIRYKGRVYAYLNRCGHVPTELDWTAGKFFDLSGLYLICATHGALFAPDSGACLGGRCQGRGLMPVAVAERDGSIYLIESD